MTNTRLLCWSIAWSLLVAGLGATEARAGQPSQCRSLARAKLDEAAALAAEESYIAALAAIDDGLACDPRNIDLLHLRAKTSLDRLDYAGARAAYRALLGAGLSGPNRRQVERILVMLSPVESTFVEIALNVPADVYLEGKARGKACAATTTCRLPLLPNTYRIIIERPNFKPARHVVRVQRGETVTITQELEELPSPLALSVTPADAVVTVDGRVWRPGEPAELPAGEYEVRAWREGFFAHQARISAHLGQPIALSIELEERLPVSVSPPGARLIVDGQPVELEAMAVRLSAVERRIVAEGVLRLPGALRVRTVVVEAEGHEPMTLPLPAERTPGDVLDVALVPVPPPPPEPPVPSTPPGIWMARSGTSAATLGSLGVAAFQAVQAQRHTDRAMEYCSRGPAGVLSCSEPGLKAVARAERAATRANQAFALSASLAVGTLYAWNAGEQPDARMSMRRKLSIGASAGVAAAGLAVGVLNGRRARDLRDQAEQWCDAQSCESSGFVLMRQARTAASSANLGFGVAGVAAAGAALLWWRAPGPGAGSESRLSIAPELGPDSIGLTLSGGFR